MSEVNPIFNLIPFCFFLIIIIIIINIVLFLLLGNKRRYDELRGRIKKISIYVGSTMSIVLVLLVVSLIAIAGTFGPFLVWEEIFGSPDGTKNVSYAVYVKAEKKNSIFHVQIPIPLDEGILKNLAPYKTGYENASNYNFLNCSIMNSEYGRVLDITSDGNLTLVVDFVYPEKIHWDSSLSTQKNESKAWVYLNRSDSNNTVSVFVIYSGLYEERWGATTYGYQSVSSRPIRYLKYYSHTYWEIIEKNYPQELFDGWNEYTTFSGQYET